MRSKSTHCAVKWSDHRCDIIWGQGLCSGSPGGPGSPHNIQDVCVVKFFTIKASVSLQGHNILKSCSQSPTGCHLVDGPRQLQHTERGGQSWLNTWPDFRLQTRPWSRPWSRLWCSSPWTVCVGRIRTPPAGLRCRPCPDRGTLSLGSGEDWQTEYCKLQQHNRVQIIDYGLHQMFKSTSRKSSSSNCKANYEANCDANCLLLISSNQR